MKLSRYVSFESFVDLIQSRSLNFVYPPAAWEDTYEGFLYHVLKTPHGRDRILSMLNEKQRSLAEFVLGNDIALSMCRYICFSEALDSLAMWSIYSNSNKAIMFETSSEEIRNLKVIDERTTNNVDIMPVRYIDMFSLEEEIAAAFNEDSFNSVSVFRCKRKAFAHEKEWRAYIGGVFNLDKSQPYRVPINNMKNFLKNVLVHPSAPKWYVEIVREFCSKNDIVFGGQSNIFEFRC